MIRRIIWILLTGFMIIIVGSGQAQLRDLLKKVPKKVPGIENILKSKPPITTSIQDAVTEIPFLDDFNPQNPLSMTVLPRISDGDFLLDLKGYFRFECKSYCLRAGTYAPNGGRGGKGYIYAPLKGPYADIVRNLLQKSYIYPEIPQRDIQVLMWGVISRTKVSKMSRDIQLTATKLLTKKEIFKLNGGALGLVPDEALRAAMRNMPSSVRRVLEAEAQLRRMLTRGSSSYAELERVAVLQGEPPLEKGDREVPRGRWSYHPNGYFIRYFPRTYARMFVEMYVPELFQIDRDGKGRITAVADMEGNRIETEYDDAIDQMSISGESSLKGYAFRSIRFERLNPDDPDKKMSAEWNNLGWTFMGVPEGGGKIANLLARFSDMEERYDWAKKHKKDLERLDEGIKKVSGITSSRGFSEENVSSIISLGHYAMALKKVLNSDASDQEGWTNLHIDLVKKAWQSEVKESAGIYRTAHRTQEYDGRADVLFYNLFGFKRYEGNGSSPGVLFSPLTTTLFSSHSEGSGGSGSGDSSGGAAQPGLGGSQRLAPSPNDAGDKDDCQGTVGMVKGDVKINGKQVQEGDTISDLNGAVIETGEKSRIKINAGENVEIRLGSNSKSTLKDPCGSGGRSGFSGELLRGRIFAVVSRLVGGSGHVVITGANAASGVRGEIRPLLSGEKDRIWLASLTISGLIQSRILNEYEEYADLMPGEAEIDRAHAVVMVDKASDDSLHVEVIKGMAKLKDSAGYVRILKAGQSFTKKSKPGYDPGDLKRIYVIVDY